MQSCIFSNQVRSCCRYLGAVLNVEGDRIADRDTLRKKMTCLFMLPPLAYPCGDLCLKVLHRTKGKGVAVSQIQRIPDPGG